MKQIVAVIFGLGLLCNAVLFVPQVVAVWRKKSDEGMAASLLTCGSVTALTVFYRVRRLRSAATQVD